MITFKDFKQSLEEQVQQTAVNDATPLEGMPPAMITMVRQSVRTYPTVNVALYYAQQIRKYFTILYR
ncbi:MAG: hypothetical protein RL768_429 [Nitrospirota bacterium]|jgi:hypothetical protein